MSTDVRPPALGLASTRRCLRTCSTATSTRGLFLQETHTTHAYIDAIIHNIRTASQKNIPHIVDCNLKNDRRIEIIFDTNIPDTAGHWVTIQFPTSPNICSCTTWWKQKQRAKQCYELIKITHNENIFCPHFCHFGWQFIKLSIMFNCLQKNCSKCRPICNSSCDLDVWPWNAIGFQRLSRYMFVQNFIKLSAAVHELSC